MITTELRTADHTIETGGILLGHHIRDTVTVRHAGTPGPAAVRTPTYFLRDLAHAQALADEAFTTDASVWIGEWHTHPTGPPAPSARDTATYRRLLGDAELGFHSIVALILAYRGGRWTESAWTCHGQCVTPVELTNSLVDKPL
ncbi:Mov34/MPN/PAD-1 family protein [Actinacidiphila reveromycinica]|uniref:Mov34/MPN/PAD-1 family protein n=1 Tax=Actinacidiphila reveromycinica TaxID=659352 RepID=UPI001F356842|nr:Mov34/MPN/PAD-1 family protein [Streptomyces sp. SN-593]